MTRSQHEDPDTTLLRMANRLSRAGAWRWDVVHDNVTWTEMLYEIFEVPTGSPVDLTMALRSHTPQSERKVRAAIELCISEHKPYDLRLEFNMPSGRHVWAQAQGRAEVDEAGTVIALFGSFQDITAQVAAEQARAEAQSDLAFVIDRMPDGFFMIDADWRFTMVNPASQAMLQRDPATLIGQNIWSVYPEAIGSTFWHRYHAAQDTGESSRFVEYFGPLDIWFEVAVNPARNGIAVHFRDISERIRERQDLRLFRTAVETMGAGVVILDGAPDDFLLRPVVYANQAAVQTLGRSCDALIGETLAGFFAAAANDDKLKSYSDRISAGKTATDEFVALTFAGEKRLLNCIAAPLMNDQGVVTHIVIILDDMTDRRQAEREAQRSERLALIGQMAGGVSHDFNNLLAVIMGNIEMLEFETSVDEAAQLREEAVAAVQRGKSLNDSLLAFAGRAQIAPQVQDLPAFVTSIEPLLRRAVPSSAVLEFALGEWLPPVMIDLSMAESCLLNLIINAREAIDKTGRIRVAVSEVSSPHPRKTQRFAEPWVSLSVADDGVGIPEAQQDKVFDPFFTTRGVGEGSGLGLSRVKGYVEQLGGFVTLESTLGKGTCVTLHFPVAAVIDSDVQPVQQSAAPGGNGRILFVEDTPAVARISKRLLESLGYTVVACNDPTAAEAAFERDGPFTHLVTDVVMPGRSGTELASDLRRKDSLLKVLLISGYPEHDPALAGLARPVAFVAKPATRSTLAATLKELG